MARPYSNDLCFGGGTGRERRLPLSGAQPLCQSGIRQEGGDRALTKGQRSCDVWHTRPMPAARLIGNLSHPGATSRDLQFSLPK
jgi:hypothetical protein